VQLTSLCLVFGSRMCRALYPRHLYTYMLWRLDTRTIFSVSVLSSANKMTAAQHNAWPDGFLDVYVCSSCREGIRSGRGCSTFPNLADS
jgi:hypothetical protein